MTLIKLRLAQHRRKPDEGFLHEAAEIVNRLLVAAEADTWWGQVIELSILQALLYQERRDTTGMLGSLERALAWQSLRATCVDLWTKARRCG